jgi:hypothetical protein
MIYKADILYAITDSAKVYPGLLPHLLVIYELGYRQAKLDAIKSRENTNYMWGINYGSEMQPNN